MWRRFELGGLLGSFFEVKLEGAELRVKIGSGARNAREQVRKQPTAAAARVELERLVAAHVARGYVEVAPFAERASPELAPLSSERRRTFDELQRERAEHSAREAEEARQAELRARRGIVAIAADRELEAQCEASPEDPAPWAIYADWLIEQSDPRGLVAQHELRGDRAGAAELFALHRETLCFSADASATFAFRHGFASGMTIGNTQRRGGAWLSELVATLLAAPIGRFIESVRTGLSGFGSENTWQPTLAAILRSPRAAHLRELRFDNYNYDDCMMHWVDIGDLSALHALPRLESLHVRGDNVTWGELALPRLRRLVRESCTLKRPEVAQICRSSWPALEHLELWFGMRDFGCSVQISDLEPILAATAMPRLGHLGIINCELVEQLIPVLAKSRLLPQLYSLELSMGTLGEQGATLLAHHAGAFRHLASLDLSSNLLEPAASERIAAALDNVVIGPQREFDGDPEEDYRYVAEHE